MFVNNTAFRSIDAYRVIINWGDGTSSPGTLGVNDIGYFVDGTHLYQAPGNYQVTTAVQVIADPSLVAFGESTATVTARALTASPLNVLAFAGVPFVGGVASFVDSLLFDANATSYVAAINWGDGTPLTGGTIVPIGPGAFAVGGSHVYAAAGQFPVTVYIVKQSSLDQATAYSSAVVQMAPPPPPPSFVVTNTNDSGPGSLRQVILNADSVGGHSITFAIPTFGVATIGIDSPLPMITGPTSILGPTQQAFEGIFPPVPLVEIDGRAAGQGAVNGLTFGAYSAGSLLLGVSIYGFSGAQVEIAAPNVTLLGNDIGVRADGTVAPTPGEFFPTASLSNRGVEVLSPGAVIGGSGHWRRERDLGQCRLGNPRQRAVGRPDIDRRQPDRARPDRGRRQAEPARRRRPDQRGQPRVRRPGQRDLGEPRQRRS